MAFIDKDPQQDIIKANVPNEIILAPDFYKQYFDGVSMLLLNYLTGTHHIKMKIKLPI